MSGGTVGAVLLAAGGSTRLGESKALLAGGDGVPRVVRVARDLAAAGCTPIVVVLGAEAERVAAALAGEAVRPVTHAGWTAGMGSSIAAGVRALEAALEGTPAWTAVGAALVAPCDMPGATVAHLRWLVEASGGGTWRVASGYADGARGMPAVLPRGDWPALQALTGEGGARALLRGADVAVVPLADGDGDLDTPEAVRAWRASWGAIGT
ncbi:MAG: nucleotidyltransferase family protein [Gemmatimonadetes bacterium]|nr:nucleotidyltransferase family protein [Gemmatimonadota bacterium]